MKEKKMDTLVSVFFLAVGVATLIAGGCFLVAKLIAKGMEWIMHLQHR